jgi:DNA-binding NarL/FixJ family response regulator
MDVLQLVAEGRTNGAIAERPVLSPRTVETHVANLVAKAKVTGHSGLTRLANSGTAAD